MKEADFQARIIAMAERFGWKVWHVPAPMRWSPKEQKFVPAREGAGLPDLILLHDDPPRIVFMELKGDGGKLSDKQREFLQAAKEIAEQLPGLDGDFHHDQRTVGVVAAWPDDEEAVERLLRTCVVQ